MNRGLKNDRSLTMKDQFDGNARNQRMLLLKYPPPSSSLCTNETVCNANFDMLSEKKKDGQKKKELAVRCPIRAGFVRYSIPFHTLSTLHHTVPPLSRRRFSSVRRKERRMNTNPVDTPLIHAGLKGPCKGLGKRAPQGFSRQNNATKRAMVVWFAGAG